MLSYLRLIRLSTYMYVHMLGTSYDVAALSVLSSPDPIRHPRFLPAASPAVLPPKVSFFPKVVFVFGQVAKIYYCNRLASFNTTLNCHSRLGRSAYYVVCAVLTSLNFFFPSSAFG